MDKAYRRLILLALFLGFFALSPSHAQTHSPITPPNVHFVDASGNPCAGCKLYSYVAGTSTPHPTYTASSGSTQNTNPVVMDASGTAANGIWLDSSSYKFVLTDSTGTTIWTADNVEGALGTATGAFLPLAGGTLTGPLIGTDGTFSGALTSATLTSSANKVINVQAPPYNATGNGVTNDCAAITAAEAARDAQGGGELYFPKGNYNVGSSCHISVTTSGTISGAGSCSRTQSGCASMISSSDTTGVLFTVSANSFLFFNIALTNTATPTAGSAILTNGTDYAQKVNYTNCSVSGFYDDIDQWVGALWSMTSCYIGKPVRYGMWIQNTVNQDAGDWIISDSFFDLQNNTALGGIHITGAGGGKFVGNKIIGQPTSPVVTDGIYANSTTTSQLIIASNSIEQLTGSAINVPNWSILNIADNYLENSAASVVSPILGTSVGDIAITGGTILPVNPASPDITLGSSSNGYIGFYNHNPLGAANSVPSSVYQYSDGLGNLIAPGAKMTIGTGGQTTAYLYLKSNGGDSSLICSWTSSGCVFTLPRNISGNGYYFKNNGASTNLFYINSTGGWGWNDGTYTGLFTKPTFTANRTYALPDAGGTVGVIPSFSTGKAICETTAHTLGHCSTTVDASGNCTCS